MFIKAAHSDFGVRSLRFELRVSKAVNMSHAPAIPWHFETAGWLVVGFEHCAGPHADLSPGSPDLDLLGEALATLGKTQAPDAGLFSPKERLGFEHPAMDGNTLVHPDLGPTTLIVAQRGLRIVDWAMATRAAPWVELAMLVPWLIGSGHTSEQAETWLAHNSAWSPVHPSVLDKLRDQERREVDTQIPSEHRKMDARPGGLDRPVVDVPAHVHERLTMASPAAATTRRT